MSHYCNKKWSDLQLSQNHSCSERTRRLTEGLTYIKTKLMQMKNDIVLEKQENFQIVFPASKLFM